MPRTARIGRQEATAATRKGSKWLRGTLTECSKAVVRTKGTYLSARYHRIKSRRGHAKATVATGHKILTATYHVLRQGVPYHELGEEFSSAATPRTPSAIAGDSSDSSSGSATKSPSRRSRRPPEPQRHFRFREGASQGKIVCEVRFEPGPQKPGSEDGLSPGEVSPRRCHVRVTT